MATLSTSRLALVFGLSAGAAALATVFLTRPRGQQPAAVPALGLAPATPRREQLRGVVRDAHPDAFTPVLSLQAKPGEPS